MGYMTRIVRHDFSLIGRNKQMLASTGFGLGLILMLVLVNLRERPLEEILGLFFFLFVGAAVAMPITLAVNGVVGEKERGTMEALLLLPLSRSELVLAKMAVTLVAALAGLLIVYGVSLACTAWMAPPGSVQVLLDPRILFTALVLAPMTVVPFSLGALALSARAPDAQTASANALLLMVPLWVVLFGVWMGVIGVTGRFLIASSAVLAGLAWGAFRLAIVAFSPEVLIRRRR
jgi:ABC-type Na+ efflux pump permease subunit